MTKLGGGIVMPRFAVCHASRKLSTGMGCLLPPKKQSRLIGRFTRTHINTYHEKTWTWILNISYR
jgi:hypothetical protein